ncbi:probable receptor-like protein kinase At1g49730, partial [Asparagus officinalis]|uniref:probable receptor-like protein kinase At1g49730 n=1 Tax=Asparagus officinalis TaxID=4686 RepID=UPI00098E6FC2
ITNIYPEVSDCPLDLSWPNFTLAASSCSTRSGRAKCCRYMNAFVTVSLARYAKTTGNLGVPASLTDICLNHVSENLNSYGIPPNATIFCGLGEKIHVSNQCQGRSTVLEMLQSPNFDDVIRNCKMPLSNENSCRRCLNSDILYLRHLIGVQDNVTLSTCRDAAFVALSTQGDNFSPIDFAGCFFSVKELAIHPVNDSEPPSQPLGPEASPSPVSSKAPAEHLIAHSPLKKHRHKHWFKLITSIGIMVIGSAILLLVILILLIRKKSRELTSEGAPIEISSVASPYRKIRKNQRGQISVFRRYSYREIKKATDNFNNTIGRGGFATVYKAQFDDGSIAAVKRMKRFSQHGEKEFYREMELIGKLHHRHLLSLRGFCLERHEKFLLYEYMENGSLKDHLHSLEKAPLAWHTRIQIAIDVANALEYLHFYCDPPLCHSDIKSSNILLDGNFLAKVADFGLAHASRSAATSFEPVETIIQVTPGYVDPEFVVTQELTEKSDVYSYGVLLLELFTGKRVIHNNITLLEWSQEFMDSDSKLSELIDPRISNSFNIEQFQVIVRIIQWCTEREGTMRPTTTQVIRLLYERLDPLHSAFLQAMEDEGDCGVQRESNRDEQIIAFSGDPRYLSSSGTSRSYCSRSVLLESSPHSPNGVFST